MKIELDKEHPIIDCWNESGPFDGLDMMTISPKYSGMWINFEYPKDTVADVKFGIHVGTDDDDEGSETEFIHVSIQTPTEPDGVMVLFDRETGRLVSVKHRRIKGGAR